MDATNINGDSLIQPLPYDGIEMWHGHPDLYMNILEEILNTPDDSDIVYFVEVDLNYPDNIKEKTKNFPFAPGIYVFPKDKYNDYMKKIQPKKYAKAKNIKCESSDKKNFSIQYRMLKFDVRHGMILDKFMKQFLLNKVTGWKDL